MPVCHEQEAGEKDVEEEADADGMKMEKKVDKEEKEETEKDKMWRSCSASSEREHRYSGVLAQGHPTMARSLRSGIVEQLVASQEGSQE